MQIFKIRAFFRLNKGIFKQRAGIFKVDISKHYTYITDFIIFDKNLKPNWAFIDLWYTDTKAHITHHKHANYECTQVHETLFQDRDIQYGDLWFMFYVVGWLIMWNSFKLVFNVKWQNLYWHRASSW